MQQELVDLHKVMMDKYFDDGWSETAVQREYHRTVSLIRKLIRAEKLKGRTRLKTRGSKDPRRRENRRALSQMHSIVGVRVAYHRSREKLNMTDFGLKVDLSRTRIGELESGSFDFTLTQLQKIAVELDITLIDLITEKPLAR